MTTTDLVPRPVAPDHGVTLVDVAMPERLSATTLMAAERCMLAAFLSRQANPSGEPAISGSHFHDIAAQVGFQAKLEGRETYTPDEAERIGMRVLARVEEREARPLSREMLDDVIDMVRRWAAVAAFPVKASQYEVEISVRNELAGQTLSGRIDLRAVDGSTAFIDDYKTGRRPPSQHEVERTHVQLPTYAWHTWKESPDVELFVLREIYPRSGAVREVTYTIEDIVTHERWLRLTAERLQRAWAARSFEPVPGRHCKYCPNPAACPLPEWARPESIRTDEQAREQLAALAVEKARLKEREKIIKSYLELRMDDEESPEIEAGEGLSARISVGEPGVRFDREKAEAAGLDLEPFKKPINPSKKLKVDGV